MYKIIPMFKNHLQIKKLYVQTVSLIVIAVLLSSGCVDFNSTPSAGQKEFTNSIDMEFILIPAGEFMMGTLNNKRDEGPLHRVTISEPFYLGKYEVTQEQWFEVMGTVPSKFKNGDLPNNTRPVEEVSWLDAQDFILKLNENENTDKYRLPSEAEWEYACRAGTNTTYSFGNDGSIIDEYAWVFNVSDLQTHPVGQKKPNPWGLYDMHGNVQELVQDEYSNNYKYTPVDGSAYEREDFFIRVARGGSWASSGYARSAVRDDVTKGDKSSLIGFRIVREI